MSFKHLFAGVAAASLFAGAAAAQDRNVETKAGPVSVTTWAEGLDDPWGMAFMPDGRMLVTEKDGALRIVGKDGAVSGPVSGVAEVSSRGQGGLLDVALAPDFAESGMIYLSFSEPGEGGSSTALARGVLKGDALENVEVIFSQTPKVGDTKHYGSRIVFDGDKLYLSMGDRGQKTPSQDLGTTIGKVVRLNLDGSVPEDNPFVGKDGARPEIWSYGHRNGQGLARHPETGALWELEFGPKGGDELNLIKKGANYGWPDVSDGVEYSGAPIPDHATRPEFEPPVKSWVPAISPSGMTFYTGDLFPDWKNDILISGLGQQGVVRVTLDGDKFGSEERISVGTRIRDIETGPDGAIYALAEDDGAVLRLAPVEKAAAN
jgi:glucose/arabinose dehydrogenase